MYSIFAPGKTSINVADVGTALTALVTPQVQDYLASTVQAQARQRGYIVNRSQSANRSDLLDISITLVDHTSDFEHDVALRAQLRDVIATWARRSRVPGVSGDRVAVVGPMEQVASHVNGETDAYEIQVRLGTAVFFNDRRVTVDFAQDHNEFTQDLKNLFDHLGNAGAIGVLNGVIVEHEEFGEVHSGNTQRRAPVQTPVQLTVVKPATYAAPQAQAAAPAPVQAQAQAPVQAQPVAQVAVQTDEEVEDLVNVVRMHSALLRITNRAELKNALAELAKHVKNAQDSIQ